MAKYILTSPHRTSKLRYKIGDEIELTAEQAKSPLFAGKLKSKGAVATKAAKSLQGEVDSLTAQVENLVIENKEINIDLLAKNERIEELEVELAAANDSLEAAGDGDNSENNNDNGAGIVIPPAADA